MQRQDMNLTIAVMGAELDPRNDAHTHRVSGRGGEGNPGDCVVIGKCQRANAHLVGSGHHVVGRQRAVGRRRVAVKIDEA